MDPAAAGQLGGRPRKLVAETKKTDKAVASGKQGTLQFSGNSIVIHHVSAPVTINISGHAHAAPALAGSKRRIGDADKDEDGSGGESGESDGEDAEEVGRLSSEPSWLTRRTGPGLRLSVRVSDRKHELELEAALTRSQAETPSRRSGTGKRQLASKKGA